MVTMSRMSPLARMDSSHCLAAGIRPCVCGTSTLVSPLVDSLDIPRMCCRLLSALITVRSYRDHAIVPSTYVRTLLLHMMLLDCSDVSRSSMFGVYVFAFLGNTLGQLKYSI